MHAEEDPLGCQEGSSQVRMREVTGSNTGKNIPGAARTEAEARGMSWLCEDVVRWVWAGGIQGRGGGAGKGEAAGKTG